MDRHRWPRPMGFCLLTVLIFVPLSAVQSKPEAEYVDRALYPEAYGILTSDHLMFPVDVSDWPVKLDDEHQLFVDDYLIASKENLTRETHQPVKDPRNPLMVANQPWERESIIPMFVLRDETTGKFRMWYSTRLHYTEPGGTKVRFPTLYAESDDGIVWRKPNLRLLEYDGSKENNFVIHGGRIKGLFINPDPDEPEERFTALVLHEPLSGHVSGEPQYVKREGYYLYESPDGLHWTGDLEHCVIPSLLRYDTLQDGIGDTTIFRYDRLLKRYVCSAKFVLPNKKLGKMRCRGQCESKDLIHWTRPRFTIYPDERDEPDTQIYGNISFPYENMWLGLLRVMHTERTGWKQVEIELSMSRDGMTWTRPADRAPFLPLGGADSWEPDYTDPCHNGPILVGNELWFYYRGCRAPQRDHVDHWNMRVGLARLRQDGFISLNASDKPGKVTTRPLTFEGQSLFVNAEVGMGGWIKAGLLSEDSKPIQNYSLKDSVPGTTGGIEVRIQWKQHSYFDVSSERHVRIVFELRNAKLYSFWVQ